MKGACDVMIYMDNAATTKMHPDVVRAMLPYMGNRYGNPSGIYTFSKNIKKRYYAGKRTACINNRSRAG